MRLIRWTVVFVVLLSACGGKGLPSAGPDAGVVPPGVRLSVRDSPLDILVVVDNSGGMAWEQEQLRADLPALIQGLRQSTSGLPDLHFGVTTTDLGTGSFEIPGCEQMGGDAGALITSGCANPVGGAPYLIDVRPRDCDVVLDAETGTCSSHDCIPAGCHHEPTTILVEDPSTGCPRCRNYEDTTLEEAAGCLILVGEQGCGFEQPLEAMVKALDGINSSNAGFERFDAALLVLFLSDEDDCSANNPQLFDNTSDWLDVLGPLSSYRCFEFGVTCDVNDRVTEGVRHNCLPRDDPAALLHPPSRYIQFLQSLKDPSMLYVAALAGPVLPSAEGGGFDVDVVLDADGDPGILPSCADIPGTGEAAPGIRLHSFVSQLQSADEMQDWAYSPICYPSYVQPLSRLGQHIAEVGTAYCLPAPLDGCADPGVEEGTPQHAEHCPINAACRASCQVTRISGGGMTEEEWNDVPHCVAVCPAGACPDNTDPAVAYAGARPADVDPDLPVHSCWYIDYAPECHSANGARLAVASRYELGVYSRYYADCASIPVSESDCADGADNDQDCLVDLEDPDCTP